jgi:hypothetical protein
VGVERKAFCALGGLCATEAAAHKPLIDKSASSLTQCGKQRNKLGMAGLQGSGAVLWSRPNQRSYKRQKKSSRKNSFSCGAAPR